MTKASRNYSLVLIGGGARGAYQVGVLEALIDIFDNHQYGLPFKTFVASSAGAINLSIFLSSLEHAGASLAVEDLKKKWLNLGTEKIYRTDWGSMALNGMKWLKSLTLEGHGESDSQSLSLLNPEPLYTNLVEQINIKNISPLINKGIINSFAINCFCFNTGKTISFFESNQKKEGWKRFKRVGINSKITLEHLKASSAIPILFPPIKVGKNYLSDGSVRDYAPFAAPIHLGATKILMVTPKGAYNEEYTCHTLPTTAKIISSIIDGMMTDSVDIDFEKLNTINELSKRNDDCHVKSSFQQIDAFIVRPSRPVTSIALKHYDSLPGSIKYFVKGLGTKEDTAELISYILFEKDYIEDLIHLGYKDTLKKHRELTAYFDNP